MSDLTMPRWWLSFADETGFLGGALVRGVDALDAVRRAHRLRCNPGGEVKCRGPYADDEMREDAFPAEKRERLLSLPEIPGAKPWAAEPGSVGGRQ